MNTHVGLSRVRHGRIPVRCTALAVLLALAWGGAAAGGELQAGTALQSAGPPKTEEKPAPLSVTVKRARWYEDQNANLRPGTRELLVILQLENRGKTGVLIADKNDLTVTAVQDGTPQDPLPAKGICVDGAFQWKGLPEGIELQTKSGWASSIGLGEDPNLGTHLFFALGAYKLTLHPGGKLELPVLFVVPAKPRHFTLKVKGGRPGEVVVTK